MQMINEGISPQLVWRCSFLWVNNVVNRKLQGKIILGKSWDNIKVNN